MIVRKYKPSAQFTAAMYDDNNTSQVLEHGNKDSVSLLEHNPTVLKSDSPNTLPVERTP
jgi:hypothetical protein